MVRWLKFLGGLSAAVAVALAGLWVLAWLARPNLDERPPRYTAEEIEAAEDARDIRFDGSDPSQFPSLHAHVDYDQGSQGAWWPRGESPILADLVEEGHLPPVHERVGPEPAVMRGVDGIGTYGGTWLRLAIAPDDIGIITWRLSYASLFRWSPMGEPIEPHLAKGVEMLDGHREFIVTLRRGIRWSDGHPFTADDIMYWWEHEQLSTTVGAGSEPFWMIIGGEAGRLEKIDDYTIRFVFPKPYGSFLQALAGYSYTMANSPRHYLSRYHPDLGDEAFIASEMQAYGMPSVRSLYSYMKQYQNPEHPRMWPWVYRSYRSAPPQVFVRNPYYYVVDEEGNQLPYIDRMQFDVVSSQMLPVAFSNGSVSMQGRHVRYENYTELMTRADAANFRILHWYPSTRSVWQINPAVNRLADPAQPETRWKRQLLGDNRFRQALSLAIDRKAIIKAEYNNQVRPLQVDPGPESPYHHPELAHAFTEYDPQRASALLDELGLTERDIEGMRKAPDGTPLTFYLDFTQFTGMGPAQFVADDWADVGIRMIPRERARTLWQLQMMSGDFDFLIWTSESDTLPLVSPRTFVPRAAVWAPHWRTWYDKGGFYDLPASQRYEGPPPGHPVLDAIAAYEKALQAPTLEEQKVFLDQVMDVAAEQIWTINVAEAPPQPVIVKNDFRNVPKIAMFGARIVTPGNAGMETYFFENPYHSPGALHELRQALVDGTLRPRTDGSVSAEAAAGDTGATAGGFLGWVIRVSVIGIGVLLVTLVALRHPFVARRLLIMVPTLLVISLVVFTIIQVPPGDFLTSKLIELRESGDLSAEERIDDLRKLFRFDDPVWLQYSRWMGFQWFFTFDPADTGLLQGNMGRSMETTEPVNRMVGDRIVLTFLISLGTIIFTWTLAIPIGVYSAVRQYSFTDYALTLVGFIGMSAPGFLLALVLMSLAGVGAGLFSPEFAAQPEWSWPKVLDLLKHVWIPIVVLGVGGTASMIRIMRANLLDELRKPYVTTARAKGVRPIKLLFKYPVRVALNPFVSGIGSLFPQLVSGGAIVAMVLALPTVGPLLLSALFSQDMYLAGSMLMVLSLLSVFGTLVSDLLLLWLDPRIRYEGGTH